MKTRVGRHMDTSRLASAVKRPGIDTRCWVSLAIALDDAFVDEKHGVFVDVQLVPTEEQYTARLGPIYAGNGFGFYRRVRKDDELAVLVPSGEAAEGPVIISQMHNAVDLPPQQAIDDPDEVMLVVEPERNLRLAVSGDGEVNIDAPTSKVTINSPDIEMGDVANSDSKVTMLDGSKSVIIGETLEAYLVALVTYIENAIVPTGVGPSGTILLGSGPAPIFDQAMKSSKIKMPDG